MEVMSKEDIENFYDLSEDVVILKPYETFNKGIIGSTDVGDNTVLCYSYEKLIDALTESFTEDGSEDPVTDALEWFDYNTLRALNYFPVEKRPIIIYNTEVPNENN